MKKQIEEMRGLIHEEIKKAVDSGLITWTEFAQYLTERLTEQRYRKQSDGEWISVDGDVIFKCSICEAEISTSWDYENEDMFSYCPCCGANMTGGEEL